MAREIAMVQVHPFRRARGTTEYLILERAHDEPAFPGLWQVVTGGVRTRETAWQAALREMREETGIEPVRSWVVPYVGNVYHAASDRVLAIPAFACEVPPDAAVQLSREHQAYRWCPFDDAQELLVFPSHHEGLRVLREYLLREEHVHRYTALPLTSA